MAKVNPIPPGNHTLTAGLVVKDGRKAIAFYKAAFGAQEVSVHLGPDQSVVHAELKIGDSKFYLGDEGMGAKSPQTLGGSPTSIYFYTENCDATIAKAVQAGAKVTTPVSDMFWGDRYGKITDPFGHQWDIATHIEDVSKEEMDRRMMDWFSSLKK